MGTVDDDLEAAQVTAGTDGALAELDIAPGGIVDPMRLAEMGRGHGHKRRLERLLDPRLDLIRQLHAVAPEELDAVVVVGVVGSADDNPGLGAKRPRQVRDPRRRHGT